MNDLDLMITIAERSRIDSFIEIFCRHSVHMLLTALGRGTATDETLEYLGLEAGEKSVMFTVTGRSCASRLIRDLRRDLSLSVPGNGIVVTVPLSSIGGLNSLKYFTGEQQESKGDETRMQRDTAHELLFVIANAGCTDTVMDAARAAGATGGTVIHAKGTGSDYVQKFFGVSIADERELVLIVVKSADKNNIMKAVMTEAGLGTKAKSIVFSLPVSAIAGLSLPEEDDGN